jgi:hypothetical protein
VTTDLEELKRLCEVLPNEKWSAVPQNGLIGQCHLAQIFRDGGASRATIDSTLDPAEASNIAAFIAAARTAVPNLVAEVTELRAALAAEREKVEGLTLEAVCRHSSPASERAEVVAAVCEYLEKRVLDDTRSLLPDADVLAWFGEARRALAPSANKRGSKP